MDHFYRDIALQDLVIGLVNDAHATLAQRLLDLVPPLQQIGHSFFTIHVTGDTWQDKYQNGGAFWQSW